MGDGDGRAALRPRPPDAGGRKLEILLTTNGLGLSPERIRELAQVPVMVQLSLDGDEGGSRFRRGLRLSAAEAAALTAEAAARLSASGVSWFMNATLPPAAAGELETRYEQALSMGARRLQLNYATGVLWRQEQIEGYLEGLARVLRRHRQDPAGIDLFNWQNNADPVPLCGDLIIDVDGSLYHTAALFHERLLPELRAPYFRGHLSDLSSFQGLRLPLRDLYELTLSIYPESSRQRRILDQNIRIGAAVDLLIEEVRGEV